jgi:6-pyruvoyltetrahydropterin/6-carboxytetrahydropterin synthase
VPLVIVELKKEYYFEAAHRLPFVPLEHKCARLHGHSYKVEITVQGAVDPQTGWLVDFALLDLAWTEIFERFDHRCLNDVAGLENPTSENLAAFIWEVLRVKLPNLSAISVWETADAVCTFRGQSG